MLTQDFLKEHFSYDPDTGFFTRIKLASSRYTQVKIGDIAGYMRKDGYREMRIAPKTYLEHRVVWLYVNGKFPSNEIDHINGNRSDNRICNLRDVTKSHNLMNQKRSHKNKNTSALLGVSFHKCTGKYVANITTDKRQKHLGLFDTKEQAHEAYLTAKREFHSTCTI